MPPFSIVKNDLFDEIKIGEGNAEIIITNETEFNLSDDVDGHGMTPMTPNR